MRSGGEGRRIPSYPEMGVKRRGSTEPTKLRCALRLKKWPHALRPGSTGQFLLLLESTAPAPHPRLLPACQRRRRGEEVSGRGGVDLRRPAVQPASAERRPRRATGRCHTGLAC